nr:CerR family C-terminal domain-containing protein [uncultured Undibacterium sp.]
MKKSAPTLLKINTPTSTSKESGIVDPENESSTDQKTLRVDGQEARERLLSCALRLFAEKGFVATSTREIALAAQVNISAISYYFGDKANLYRTVFNDPRANPSIHPSEFLQPDLSLRAGIELLMQTFIDSFKQGEVAQNCMKLHIREMLEPTGLWLEEIDHQIKPAHNALVKFLARHLDVKREDDDLHRLAFALSGLALTLMVSSDVIFAVRPSLISKEKAIDAYSARLVDFGLCMCEQERQRRLTA